MIIQRINNDILGVSISKNFEIDEIKDLLVEGASNVREKFPELHQKLISKIAIAQGLMSKLQTIQQQTLLIQNIEEKIVEGEKLFKKVVTVYEVKDQTIISVVGATGGTTPPYPTAAAETAPLIAQVSIAQLTLEQLKQNLEDEKKRLSAMITEFDEQKQSLSDSVQDDLIEEFGVQIDTDKEQFIYT